MLQRTKKELPGKEEYNVKEKDKEEQKITNNKEQ